MQKYYLYLFCLSVCQKKMNVSTQNFDSYDSSKKSIHGVLWLLFKQFYLYFTQGGAHNGLS